MINRIRFLAFYFLFWIGCFEGGRLLFLLYEWRNTARLNAALIFGIFLHGLRLDISLACAVMLIPLCVVARAGYLPHRAGRRIIAGYTVAVLFIWAIGTIVDLEVFSAWGYRLNALPLHYLTSPKLAWASAGGSPLLALSLLLLALLALSIFVFLWALLPYLDHVPTGNFRSVMLVVIMLPVFGVGLGGNVTLYIPLTAGSVYFSRDNFANQAAVNPIWNFFATVNDGAARATVDRFTEPAIARAIADSLLAESVPTPPENAPKLLRRRPAKVVILFWESFTAKIAEPLGGMTGITPGFTRLSKQGILFDQVYAAGTRTTNGVVAGLTGLPSHPRANPLSSPELGAALPRLSRAMSSSGYRTGFYYGAPLAFDNRNRFLLGGHYDEIVERQDFPRSDWQSPWGVHDPVTLDRLFHALDSSKDPMFAVALTLSSHEPYTVPGPVFIPGSDGEHRFLNAQRYTDNAVTRFIERAKKSSWWDSALIIILADHGHPYPARGSPLASAPEQFRIPMLWLGGSLAVRDTVVDRIGSQSDVPETLLAQLGIQRSQFKWSKDFLASGTRQFAFYAFEDGFGYVDQDGSYVFDNVAKSVIHKTGNPTRSSLRAGRAYQQVVTQAYHDLGAPHRD